MRQRTAAAAAAATVFGAGSVAVAAGRYACDAALKSSRARPFPGDAPLTVHSTAPGRVTLTRSLASLRPGRYGLTGRDCHAVVGSPVDTAEHSADTVVRRLERVTQGTLETGARMWLTPQVHIGDPGSVHGLDHADVDIPGELGRLPAWFVPGTRDTWVITAHGWGTTREHPMVLMPFYDDLQLPQLDVSHRGDLGAPRTQDGLSHLGETEWRDLDAAMRYAVRYGAQRLVLHGWSTGATMALHAVVHSPLRHLVCGLVLDSPVLDWRATVRALAAAAGIPAVLVPLALRAVQGRTGLHTDHLAEACDPRLLNVPTLVFHGADDAVAPWAASRTLAARREGRVVLHEVDGAPHAAMWNAGPARYEEILRRFLTPLL
ncbi:alpha/beta hydrolase family protein [Streptomyces meridianus]|uniref:Prolyl oligopeptidase family serine peptidase n=1 Tax=Streptomyces meridianus TaxID=2938945 RepID=A0ABT0X4Q6_9ACTN|nr:prolyl oligopeptidase family serine peptidase [Streptomyces meridianus]MCM2577522.1 prolyl oligopeptidase family serine peptidase [Streptomyces meridianus]